MSEQRLIDANKYRKKLDAAIVAGIIDEYTLLTAINILYCEQTIDAVPVVYGHWIYNKRTDSFGCSNCSMSMVRNVYSYCPWCGAKMDEVSE